MSGDEASPGSRLRPFNLAIIGGGPAGTAIILRAMHLGFAHELFNGKCRKELDLEGNSAGVCIFDNGPRSRFGGGKLQDYKINSNTNGAKFVTNLIHDRANVIPPEISTGTELEQIGKTKLAQSLLEYRATTAPLDQIGQFLVEVGSIVLDFFDSHSPHSSCFCSTEVIKLQQCQLKTQSLWRIIATNLNNKTNFEIYSRYVVLASGGKQSLPKLPSIHPNKLYSSDFVCTTAGIQELVNRLKSYPRKRIVIIGGSHSAFSAAWICLNKFGWYKDSDQSAASSHSIYIVHRHEIKVFYSCKRDADRDKYSSYEGINKQGQIHPFSGLRGDAKALYRNIRTGIETRVRLLAVGPDSSNHQSLYTRLCEEAQVIIWACGYEASLSYSIVDANDSPLPLYLKRGQVEINDLAQVQILSPSAGSVSPTDLLSTPAPVLAPAGSPVALPNLLATGLGFGLNVSGDTNRASNLCKADGVAVYLKRAATLILSHVIGPKVFGDGLTTWEQHVVENVRRWNEQQAQLRALKNASNEGNGDEDETSATVQPSSGILSPILQPSRALRNRSGTPSLTSPVLSTSPIRRQIKTASSGELTRRKREKGSQVGFVNSSAASFQKKVPASPVTNPPKRPVGLTSGGSTQPLPAVSSQESLLDSSDSDPYELYLSGLATSLDGSDNQQQLPAQFSPLRSPSGAGAEPQGQGQTQEFTDSESPPPPYPMEELDLRPFLASSWSPGESGEEPRGPTPLEQNKEPNISSGRGPLASPRLPLSLSSDNTPRGNGGCLEPLVLSSVNGGKPLLKSPQESSAGWLTPTDSNAPSPSKIPSRPAAAERVGRSLLSVSVPGRVSRATFSSKTFHRVKTLDLSPGAAPSALTARPKPKQRHTATEIHKPVTGISPPLLPALKPLPLSQKLPLNSESGGAPGPLSSLQGVKKLLVAKS